MVYISLVDASLRDGELTPGVRFSVAQKLEIAQALAAAGVDVLEVGFPGKLERDKESIPQIAKQVRTARLCVLSRALRSDVEDGLSTLYNARAPRLHLYAGGKPNQNDREIEGACAAVGLAREHLDEVAFTPLDSTRLEPQFLSQLVSAVIDAGANIVNISDTLGVATPESVGSIFTSLIAEHPDVVWSFHGHDDLGLATANSLRALSAGARQIEGCVNGLGPRAGNTALEQVVLAVQTHGARWGIETDVDLEALRVASTLLARYSGISVPPNQAVFGEWTKPGDLAAFLR